MTFFLLLNPKTAEVVTPPVTPPTGEEGGRERLESAGSIKFVGSKEYKETDPWEIKDEEVIGPVDLPKKPKKVLRAKEANIVSESETIPPEKVSTLEIAASIVRSPELEKLKEALNSKDANPIEVLKLVSRASTKAKEVDDYEEKIRALEQAELEAKSVRDILRKETELGNKAAKELAKQKRILEEEEEELLLLLAALDLLD